VLTKKVLKEFLTDMGEIVFLGNILGIIIVVVLGFWAGLVWLLWHWLIA
jgi:hypothetical protein